jgi:hypothetical protein
MIRAKFDALCDPCCALAEEILNGNYTPDDDLYAACIMSIVAATQSRGCQRCQAKLWELTRKMINGEYGE